MSAVCPECDNPLDIDVDDVEEGQTLSCDDCGTELEVVSIEPLELAPVNDDDYDDDDDDEEDDDYRDDDDDYDDDDDDE